MAINPVCLKVMDFKSWWELKVYLFIYFFFSTSYMHLIEAGTENSMPVVVAF